MREEPSFSLLSRGKLEIASVLAEHWAIRFDNVVTDSRAHHTLLSAHIHQHKRLRHFTKSNSSPRTTSRGLSQEEQKDQEAIKYPYQPQNETPVDVHGGNLILLCVDHGSTSS